MKKLLDCFFQKCLENFYFLGEDYGFREIHGLAEYIKGRKIIRPNKYVGQVKEDLLAVSRYERDKIVIELSFSNKHHTLEPYYYYKAINRLNWSDILNVFKKDSREVKTKSNITTNKDLSSAINAYAEILETHIDQFINLNDRQFDKAMTIRSAKIEQLIKEHHQNTLDQISRRAAEAFYHKDYPTVIKLFSKYKNHLAPSDLKKYNIACKKTLNH